MTTLLDRYGNKIKKPSQSEDLLNKIADYWEQQELEGMVKLSPFIPMSWRFELPESCKKLLDKGKIIKVVQNRQEAT